MSLDSMSLMSSKDIRFAFEAARNIDMAEIAKAASLSHAARARLSTRIESAVAYYCLEDLSDMTASHFWIIYALPRNPCRLQDPFSRALNF